MHPSNDTVAPAKQPVSPFSVLNDMGEHVHKIAALLRAAGNTGPDEREDESWLVSLAWDEAQRLQARYDEWATRSDEERK